MFGISLNSIIIYLALIAALTLLGYVLFKVLKIPPKLISGMVINTFLGGAGIYIGNLIFSSFGFTLGLNPITAVYAGILGLPGYVSLVIIKLLV